MPTKSSLLTDALDPLRVELRLARPLVPGSDAPDPLRVELRLADEPDPLRVELHLVRPRVKLRLTRP